MTAVANKVRDVFSPPAKLTTAAPTTLNSPRFVELVDSANPAWTVTVPAGRTKWVFNTSTVNALSVATTGNSAVQLRPGESLVCAWDAPNNKHENGRLGTAVYDLVPTSLSTKPVQSGGVFSDLADLAALIPNVAADVLTGGGDPPSSDAVITYVQDELAGGGGGVVDSIPDETYASMNAIANGAMTQYVDRRSMVRPTDRIATSTMTHQNWVDMIAELNAQGFGKIWLDGAVPGPTSTISFLAPIDMEGIGPGARLIRQHASQAFHWGNFNDTFIGTGVNSHADGNGSYVSEDVVRYGRQFKAPGLNALPGDWVIIYSDVPWTDGPWHTGPTGSGAGLPRFGNPGFPAQMVQIRRVLATDDYFIEGAFTDHFLTTQVGQNVTVDPINNEIQLTGHNFVNGNEVFFTFSAIPNNASPWLNIYRRYYVVNAAADTFQIARLPGGTPFVLSAAGADVKVFKPAGNVRLDHTTDQFTLENHELQNNDVVFFKATTVPTGLTVNQDYFVVNRNTNTFQVSLTQGGAPVTFTSNGAGLSVHRSNLRPKAWKVPVLTKPGKNRSDIVLRNFTIEHPDTGIDGVSFAQFNNCVGVQIEGIRHERRNEFAPPTLIRFKHTAQVEASRCSSDGSENIIGANSSPYGFIAEICSGLWIHHNFCRRTHHFFTTGGEGRTVANQPRRYGNAVMVKVCDNLLMGGPDEAGSGDIILDTHAEGWGIEFARNYIFSTNHPPSGSASFAISSRSRNTIIDSNIIICAGSGLQNNGIRTQSPGAHVEANKIWNASAAVTVSGAIDDQQNAQWMGDVTLKGNTVYGGVDFSTSAAFKLVGPNIRMYDNVVQGYDGKAIYGEGGSDWVIDNLRVYANPDTFTPLLHFTDVKIDEFGEAASRIAITDLRVYDYRAQASSGSGARVIHFAGAGSGHEVSFAKFRRCKTEALIKFTGGTGHRVSMCDAPKGIGTNFIDLGTGTTPGTDHVVNAGIKIVGNAADGYGGGANVLGLIGTDAAATAAAQAADNWTD